MRRFGLVLAAVATLASGCGSDDSPDAATGPPTSSPSPIAEVADAALVGPDWVVTAFIDDDREQTATAPHERSASLRFEENGFVTGHDGCNGLGYSLDAAPDQDRSDLGLTYDVTGDTITFVGSAVQTLRGCPDDADYIDRVRSVLARHVTYVIEGSTLTLWTSDGSGVIYTVEG